MDVDLTGEVAVVTGAGGRLGTIWVSALLDAGAHVLGIDLTDEPPAELKQRAGQRYLGVSADVTDKESIRAALSVCLRDLGAPTIVVNNAGIDSPPSTDGGTWRFEDVPGDLSAAVLDVNALGVLNVCQVFGSRMAEQGRGSVINIGSLYGSVAPNPRMYEHLELDPPFLKPPAYGMSKAAVAALSRYLAVLWGRSGVRVNTLSPGGVLGGQDAVFRKKFTDKVPLCRMALPEDLVGPLLFLASGMSGYVTGQELVVDGGYVCQ
ncbi:NAD(P)-dependent dehydrogenase, short-chain alcohol dehydrogenase family [Amycolatopsis xylanica]|uniref:NAD(P)-dependent dehydrogenase, short-chain alcohol dehydrogenase family n=1 Tax=Amycolatopsis xylanica TaxID=589385 RepID=A0A1H3EWX7_9PSEU|nr:SDR family oxidoreductase [Amycolatopsis xylanica]SDX83313.1 NAD(P)-dependent dehydrogenase, short-chain alcohol dehydrogenase family [Amycolatopsis xylanica]